MTKSFYVIKYQFGTWTRTHVSGLTLDEANEMAKTVENSDVIHEMWLDCLSEWPKLNYLEVDNENL